MRAATQAFHELSLTAIYLGILCIVLGVAPDVAGQTPSSPGAIEALVHQLGDQVYKVREEAAEKLVRMGHEAEPALKRGLRDADPEVRRRCEQLLPLAHRGEARIVEFLRDDDGGNELPGWRRFTGIVAAGRAARVFFADMWRADPDLMEAAGKHKRGVGSLWARRCHEMNRKLLPLLQVPRGMQGAAAKSLVSDAQLGALLYVASDRDVLFAMYPAFELSTVLRLDERLRERDESRAQLLRKLCVPVVLGQHGEVCLPETAQVDLVCRLRISMEFAFPEGISLARKALEGQTGNPETRATAAAALAKLGGCAHLPIVEAMLEDDAELRRAVPRDLGSSGPDTFQVRDIALAMVVYVTGQKHSEYGFVNAEQKEFQLFDSVLGYAAVGFADDAARRRAMAKWKEWRRAHPKG
jgi:hypothetical protein